MSKINLIDEKAINVNGEDTKVLTMPNNEPIYRSNGHQLGFNSANSDYIDFSSDITLEVGKKLSIKFDFFRTVEATRFFFASIFLDSNNSTQIGFTGDNGLFLRDSGGLGRSLLLGTFANGYNEVELIRTSSTDYTINFNGQTINTTFTSDFIFNNYFGKYFSGFDATSKVYELIINDEQFNFTNINSNAQIEGSNGTIAQVNSDNTDAVAGGSNNFLKFDGGNSD
jgi:hypothetical protein